MIPGLTSIVIPTYNHAEHLAGAAMSAVRQTVPVEVIVVDDGSTDGTSVVIETFSQMLAPNPVRSIVLPHGGPSKARNAGIEAARGEFLMLLDADDVIAPTKVERQLEQMTPEIGWVLCDVKIEDAGKGHSQLASDRYGYKAKQIGGWIAPLLEPANFIPIMSPLIRRSVLGTDIRFADTADGTPEDWRFWQKVASVARARYLPEVLATYRKQKTGRNRLPKAARAIEPNIEQPLRLNLGCGTPDTRSWHPIKGFVNLDKSIGWKFEDGLGAFTDRSVSGITISHTLMYVAESDWPYVFSEFARVLAPGGVLRITEDETLDPRSSRYGGWKGSQPAVTLTHPALVRTHMEAAGLAVTEHTAESTSYRDTSLLQAQHGTDVFFLEGTKQVGVLFAPHSDDETLFAAFTLLRYRPAVVVCFGSSGDYGSTEVREAETRDAVGVLGAGPVEQWHGGNLVAQMEAYDQKAHPTRVWAPDIRTSHPDHLAVAKAARKVFRDRLTTYHTYDNEMGGKIRGGTPVPYEPAWVHQKLRALVRYESQARHPRAHQFFAADLAEYIGEGQP